MKPQYVLDVEHLPKHKQRTLNTIGMHEAIRSASKKVGPKTYGHLYAPNRFWFLYRNPIFNRFGYSKHTLISYGK